MVKHKASGQHDITPRGLELNVFDPIQDPQPVHARWPRGCRLSSVATSYLINSYKRM